MTRSVQQDLALPRFEARKKAPVPNGQLVPQILVPVLHFGAVMRLVHVGTKDHPVK